MKKRKAAIPKRSTPTKEILYRLAKNKPAMVGLAIIIIVVIMVAFSFTLDYDSQIVAQNPIDRLQGPSAAHLLGTDQFGRDMFYRTIYGARYSLAFGVICTIVSMLGGCLIGATSAFIGGKTDNFIMRVMDAIMCIPGMLLALALVAAMGAGLKSMMVAISVSSIPGMARVVRSVVLSVVQNDYIEAAKACGVPSARIIVKHVLPNAIGTILINAAMSVSGYIMTAAGLSFIGMGIQPPTPEWGAMLSEARTFMRQYPHMVFVPGIAIVLTALAFNLLGDGLSEALDPRMRD